MCHNDLCALRKETKLSTVNTVAFRSSPSQQKYHGCTHDHSGKRDKADMSQNHRMYVEFVAFTFRMPLFANSTPC